MGEDIKRREKTLAWERRIFRKAAESVAET
jgi:hypothetical protein